MNSPWWKNDGKASVNILCVYFVYAKKYKKIPKNCNNKNHHKCSQIKSERYENLWPDFPTNDPIILRFEYFTSSWSQQWDRWIVSHSSYDGFFQDHFYSQTKFNCFTFINSKINNNKLAKNKSLELFHVILEKSFCVIVNNKWQTIYF